VREGAEEDEEAAVSNKEFEKGLIVWVREKTGCLPETRSESDVVVSE